MKMLATREAYGMALKELAKENEDIVVLDADLSKSTKTSEFKEENKERFFNMGIAEANMVSVAAGLATCGRIPFVSTFAIFAAGRAFEQIRNSVCYPNLNVKICATHAGLTVGEDGASHQAIEDISLMRSIPNMTVISPSDVNETKAVIKSISKIDGPFYVRLGRMAVEDINNYDQYEFKLGKGVILEEGMDLTLIATGIMVQVALKAKKELEKESIKARVINIHTIKPIDKEIIIKAAKETGVIITLEEHSIIGGLGSAVSEVVSENYPVYIRRIGVEDEFGQSGKPQDLLEHYGLTVNNVLSKAREIIKLKK